MSEPDYMDYKVGNLNSLNEQSEDEKQEEYDFYNRDKVPCDEQDIDDDQNASIGEDQDDDLKDEQ